MAMKRRLCAVVAMLTLAMGCSSTTGSKDEDPPAGSNADTSAPAESESPTEAADSTTQFGQAYTYEDGLTVTVQAPTPFKPSYKEVVSNGGQPIQFEVTIVNKTGATFDPSSVYTSMQSGNEEGEELFDGEAGLNGSPTTALLDGRESKFVIGYAVKDPADLVMQFSPGFEYEDVIFTS